MYAQLSRAFTVLISLLGLKGRIVTPCIRQEGTDLIEIVVLKLVNIKKVACRMLNSQSLKFLFHIKFKVFPCKLHHWHLTNSLAFECDILK